jgi:hypothetical protein
MKARFRLGKLVATPGALNAAPSPEALLDLVQRHASGDWGDLDAHDRRENEIAVRRGGLRILSAYQLDGTRFWIITESDRSVTTILLPDEY